MKRLSPLDIWRQGYQTLVLYLSTPVTLTILLIVYIYIYICEHDGKQLKCLLLMP